MKRYIPLAIYFLLLSSYAIGQNQRRSYLFNQFTNGTVLLKNKVYVQASLNYDAANHNMMYIEKETKMILDPTQGIDTIYIDNRKFVTDGQKVFLEMVTSKQGIIFINWTLRQQLRGKKGAYGQVMQGSVESIDINAIRGTSGSVNRESMDVYILLNENEYWLRRNNKFVKCHNEKSLLKLFPGKEEKIQFFIKENKLTFRIPQQAIDIVNYCLEISK